MVEKINQRYNLCNEFISRVSQFKKAVFQCIETTFIRLFINLKYISEKAQTYLLHPKGQCTLTHVALHSLVLSPGFLSGICKKNGQLKCPVSEGQSQCLMTAQSLDLLSGPSHTHCSYRRKLSNWLITTNALQLKSLEHRKAIVISCLRVQINRVVVLPPTELVILPVRICVNEEVNTGHQALCIPNSVGKTKETL